MTEVQHLFDLNIGAYLEGSALLGALAGMGLFVGFLAGLFGVGGAFLITPMLNIVFGIAYPLAIGSGLCYTIGVSSSGMRRHLGLGNVELRSMMIMAGASMVGAVLGGYLNDFIHTILGGSSYKLIMHGLFVVVLAATAYMIARKGIHRSGKALLQRIKLPPYMDLPGIGVDHLSAVGLCAVGLLIGLMKGLIGIGGGVLFMPLLILAVGLTAHQAVGTSLGVVVFSSIAGSIKYGLKGNVNLWIVIMLMAGGVFGVQLGAKLCRRLHAGQLRRWFAVVVIVAAIAIAARLVYELQLT